MGLPLAMIAGTGRLPESLAGELRAQGREVLAFSPEGLPGESRPGGVVVQRFRIERLAIFLDHLQALGVEEVVFAGAMRRPELEAELFDVRTAALVPRLLAALKAGDDTTLRVVVEIFEEHGFRVRGVHELVPALLPPPGILTAARPDAGDRADAARAATIVAALGAVDVGQACVVAQGQVLAVEALPGTDWMLARLAKAPFAARPDPACGRGLLYKAAKPGQEWRVDLPVIGLDTLAGVAAAGRGGIVLAAGEVMVLDRDQLVAGLDAAGMYLWVRGGEER